ncbi:MAG TPA: NAD(P)/FAD-dependent oxidoreductase [Polyangiaceae bacterium]|nr:NAD(P)/FAD-dependent oxidoreductase [Polyangiaceae bacterium]
MKPIGIIGGGLAGLMAALRLSQNGRPVRIFEARDTLGGRAMTLGHGALTIELGPEFVQGTPQSTLSLSKEVGVSLRPVRDRHYQHDGRRFRSMRDPWKRFAKLLKHVDHEASAADYLRERALDGADAALFHLMIEGVQAAALDDVSIARVALEAQEAVEEEGQFRPEGGFGAIVHEIAKRLDPDLVRIDLGAVVREVHWHPDGDCVFTIHRNGGYEQQVETDCCVVAVPVSVLKDAEVLRFVPELASKSRALSLLTMGHVEKLIFEFQNAEWMDHLPNADFIHPAEGAFPTFWREDPTATDKLVAWAAGPRAQRLQSLDLAEKIEQAITQLAQMCEVPPAKIRDSVVTVSHHDYSRDPFSNGAYPYAHPGGSQSPKELATPLGRALHFAGDATSMDHFATIAGALSSGTRVAREILMQ